jgi:hypothetical protein
MSTGGDAGMTAATLVVERAPEGLSRGLIPVPAWVVVVLAIGIVLLGVGYCVWRFFPKVRR